MKYSHGPVRQHVSCHASKGGREHAADRAYHPRQIRADAVHGTDDAEAADAEAVKPKNPLVGRI